MSILGETRGPVLQTIYAALCRLESKGFELALRHRASGLVSAALWAVILARRAWVRAGL